jgi:N-acetylglutamate synthase-like GNAT family acetyltransferase
MLEPATLNDLLPLSKLVNSAYRGEESKKGWTHESDLIEGNLRTDEASLKKMLEDENAVILKYAEGDTIMGCVYLKQQGKVLYLGMLSVRPDIQAKGIGKTLLAAAEDHARRLGLQKIEMTVISVRHKLIAWYERHGYHKTGKTEPFHTNARFGIPREPIEFIIMEKQLQDN